MESNDDDVCRNGRGRQANGSVHFLNDAGKVVWRRMADTRPEMVDAALRRFKGELTKVGLESGPFRPHLFRGCVSVDAG